jgi:serine/threonine-protein kinase
MTDHSDALPSLSPNAHVGHYRILDRIGAGGMGVVYKASDTKLDRLVALKVVRPELLNADGLGRLEREARALASLNHPRVAAIYGLEEFGAVRFLVLEYVPGPTLADRLRRGPLSIREALSVSKQIAEGLEAAHASGIIHRDLKPANVKVSDDGSVKVLDFGLAKSLETPHQAPRDSGLTVTALVTQEMTVLGTAAYMSPEQACGKKLDTRTDIWSFGCVLYEALAGKAAFCGETLTEVLAAAIEREPECQALPPATPAAVVSQLRRCLRKDPKSRLRDIGDARIELEDALSGPSIGTPKTTGITRRAAISALAGAALGAAATGTFAISRWHSDTRRHLTRIPILFPEGMAAWASYNGRVAISPDGTSIAFNVAIVGTREQPKLFLRPLAALESQVLSVPVGNTPFFSPDGQWLGFLGGSPQAVRKLPLGGGAPVMLCPTEASTGATWGDDETIYFVATSPGGVLRIPAAGGQPQDAVKIDFPKGERAHRHPFAVQGTRTILFTSLTGDAETFDDAYIVAVDTKSGRRQTLVEGGTHPRYSPSGHLVYARGGNLLAVRFDPTRLAISGQPFMVLEGVLMSVNSGAANFDISASGDLVYIPGPSDKGDRTLVWVDRNGRAEPLPLPPRSYLHPRFSPDGRQLAIEIEGPNHDFYLYDFARAVLTKMTTDGESHWPVWSPDGSRLAYRSGHMAAWRMWEVPADRSRAAQQLPGSGVSQSAESWSPDGRVIAYTAKTNDPGSHIMVTSLDDRQSRSIVDVQAPAGSPKFSPDGRWLAYCSSESGTSQVYVQAFPGPGAKMQVSADGGTDPVWKRTSGELYFRNGDKMMAVAVSTAPTFTAGRPQMLWEGHYSHGMSASCGPAGATSSNYDVTPDGKRFLMIKDAAPDTAISRQLVVVLGWADEVTRLSSRT